LAIGDWRLPIDGLTIAGLSIDGMTIDGMTIDALFDRQCNRQFNRQSSIGNP